MKDLVVINEEDEVTTTSRKVAEVFGKEHHNILKAIKALELPEDFNQVNFNSVEYIDAKGESRLMYELTKDGFTFLVMGFTGKKADKFKLAYITEFNRMEKHIRETELAGVQRVLSDYVSVSQFAEDNGIKKTFWVKTKLGNGCSRISLKMGVPRQVDGKRVMKYQRNIVKLVFERMDAAERDYKKANELYTQLKLTRDISF